MTLDILNLTPEKIWKSESVLNREAVDRILRAPRLPLAVLDAETEPLRLTLAYLSGLLFAYARPRFLPRDEAEDIGNSFLKLANAMIAARGAANEPPPMPQDWALRMAEWMGLLLEPAPNGPLGQIFYQSAIPKLLAFYSLAFAREPAATANGPTERFLSAFLDEMISCLQTAEWTGDPANMPDLATLITKPTPGALRQRIRMLRDSREGGQFVQYLFAKFAEATHRAGSADGAASLH